MNKFIFLVLFCCVARFHSPAQTAVVPVEEDVAQGDEDSWAIDNSHHSTDTGIYLRSAFLSADTVNRWKNAKDYRYLKKLDSLLDAYQKSIQPEENTSSGSPSFLEKFLATNIVKAILWTLGIFFVCFIVYRLFLAKGVFRKNTSYNKIPAEQDETVALMELDYDQLIHNACKMGDYRIAVRYLFLKTLQRLNERSLIEFAADKTNSRYVDEVPVNKRNEFSRAVLNYEYVWYGNIIIDKNIYERIESAYQSFLNKI